ncbi:MAG: hypothetical protein LBC51_06325 [Treponema sp.]|jgi:two-component system NarL family sensor kinase|nr:hypothetical protein [Treponema sp.]
MVPELSANEFEVYFRLVWLFVIIMFFIIAVLYYLYLAMRRARDRESESMAFSRLVIAGQEADRRRVSCELHDTVLTERRCFAGDGDAEVLARRQSFLAGRIREICAELMPPDFSRLSLVRLMVRIEMPRNFS